MSNMRLLQKSLFVIPEVFIGNPVFFKTKDFWIPAFAGMTAKAISSILLQEPHIVTAINSFTFKEYNLVIAACLPAGRQVRNPYSCCHSGLSRILFKKDSEQVGMTNPTIGNDIKY